MIKANFFPTVLHFPNKIEKPAPEHFWQQESKTQSLIFFARSKIFHYFLDMVLFHINCTNKNIFV